MATIVVAAEHQIEAPAKRKAKLLASIPDAQIQCRAGHRHRFPSDELNPRDEFLPDTMTAVLERDGSYQITESCIRDCGRFRRFTTMAGGLFARDTVYSYWSVRDNPNADPWVVIPDDERRDLDITPRDFKGENFRRAIASGTLKRSAVKRTAKK